MLAVVALLGEARTPTRPGAPPIESATRVFLAEKVPRCAKL